MATAEEVVVRAFEDWQAALDVRQSCSSGVSIVFEPLQSRRGEYRVDTQQVVIDPEDSLEGMYAIALHELSHHTFQRCGAFADADLTRAFYAAQGLPLGRNWFDYSAGWRQTPVEQFAEAMVFTIAGVGEGGIETGPNTVEVVSNWLAGGEVVSPGNDYGDPIPYSQIGVPTTPAEVGDGVEETPKAPAPLQPEVSPPALTFGRDGEIPRLVPKQVLGHHTMQLHRLRGSAADGPR